MTLRAIHAVDEKSSAKPEWMAAFLEMSDLELGLQALPGGRSGGRR